MTTTSELSGADKAAILLLSLGTTTAAKVFRNLSEDQVEEIVVAISKLKEIPQEVQQSVLQECRDAVSSDSGFGGLEKAKGILNEALGEVKAKSIINRVGSALGPMEGGAFGVLKDLDVKQIAGFLQKEHPQTIAVVLSHLEPERSAQILDALPQDLQDMVAERIATMDRISPDVIQEIAAAIEKQFAPQAGKKLCAAGGVQAVADILNKVDSENEKRILSLLEERAPELSEEVKKRMFVFEDLARLDKMSMQRVMKDVDMSDITLALKVASEELKEAIYAGVSKRARSMIAEELEFLGPVRLKDVEAAQQRIIEAVRALEESGEITIPGRGGAEDQIIE